MKIKICGMKNAENVEEISTLCPDMLGFIFYEKSPRNAFDLNIDFIKNFKAAQKVGVFVNESIENIRKICTERDIKTVQLHGGENPEFCNKAKALGFVVIKAFQIYDKGDFEKIADYASVCDYALLDTKCSTYGGSGQKFAWDLLDEYRWQLPFILSGGICENDAKNILKIKNKMLFGIDLNSRFENEQKLKDCNKLKKFIKEIRG